MYGRARGWLGGKKPEPTDRVTRAASPPSSARVSYNDDIVPPGFLYETDSVLTAVGIKDEFDNLCAAGGLTHLVTHQVSQYPKLTYYFVNWFRFNETISIMEFGLYDEVLTMSLEKFCQVLGVWNVGKTDGMKMQPSELKA